MTYVLGPYIEIRLVGALEICHTGGSEVGMGVGIFVLSLSLPLLAYKYRLIICIAICYRLN